jgi:hypothetical protein
MRQGKKPWNGPRKTSPWFSSSRGPITIEPIAVRNLIDPLGPALTSRPYLVSPGTSFPPGFGEHPSRLRSRLDREPGCRGGHRTE